MSVEVHFWGHLGNKLFTYALGRIIAEELGHALFCGQTFEHEGWTGIERDSGIVDRLSMHLEAFGDLPMKLPGKRIRSPHIRYVKGEKENWQGHLINLPYILEKGADRRIVLAGYFQRAEYYVPYRDRIREWYRLEPDSLGHEVGPKDAVLHVRRSLDMRLLDRQLELSYYIESLEECQPERVYVCGLGLDDTALREALAPWNPVYLDADAVATLRFISGFKKIILANSTFSWWAAFLSDAEVIYNPVPWHGPFSPDSTSSLVVEEDRYRNVRDVPLEIWRPFRLGDAVELRREAPNVYRVERPSQEAQRLRVPEEKEISRDFLAWLLDKRDPFGAQDLAEGGLGKVQDELCSIIRQLLEMGILTEADPREGEPPLTATLKQSGVFRS